MGGVLRSWAAGSDDGCRRGARHDGCPAESKSARSRVEGRDPAGSWLISSPPQDRLQPALLDRLTDNEPDKKVEPREARVLSKRRMRESVLRDLAWLFNATQLESPDGLAKAPYVRRSVMNSVYRRCPGRRPRPSM